MKGQSEVIAIILIVMIVIGLSALAYTWFSGIFSQLMNAAGTFITGTTGKMVTSFKIEAATYDQDNSKVIVVIRNIGSKSFDVLKTSFYINDEAQTINTVDCFECSCLDFAKSCVAKIEFNGITSLPEKSKIRAIIETGFEDSKEISI
ncbi:MAG: archaellin/type IV pilin N-terminal domain-containing protein [Candidatus Aenigmatarchaeota archaeon]